VTVRPLRLAAIAAALALTAAGCGDDSRDEASTTNTTPSPAQATTEKQSEPGIAVTEREFSIEPKDAEVPKAGTITFRIRNAGGTEHALEVEGPKGEEETDAIAPGGSATLKVVLDKPGRYEWYCPIGDHKDRGMRGTVVVAGGGKSAKDDKGGEKDKKSGGSGSGDSMSDDSGGGSDDESGGVAPPSDGAPSDDGYNKG
jgi:uncharacterized cupredoxin-like copper-binding protein